MVIFGLKYKHSTYTSLHSIFDQITKGFNNPREHHTVAVALDMSKAFDTVNKNKLILTNIPNPSLSS